MALNDYENNIDEIDVTRGIRIDPTDSNLMSSVPETLPFGDNPNDIMVIRLYDRNDNIVDLKYTKDFPAKDPTTGFFMVNPQADIESFGYTSGKYKIEYLFWRFVTGNNRRPGIFIQQISASKTEVKIFPKKDEASQREFELFRTGAIGETEADLFAENLFFELDTQTIMSALSDTFKQRVYTQFNITREQLSDLMDTILEQSIENFSNLLVQRGITTLGQLNVLLNTAIKQSIQQNFNI